MSCVEKLQDDLEMLYSWEKENNMQFNARKFELLRYGCNEQLKMDTLYFTPRMEQIIEDKSELRDLGVIMSNDMKFSKHVSKVCTTVRQKIWLGAENISLQTGVFHEANVEITLTTAYRLLLPAVFQSIKYWRQ